MIVLFAKTICFDYCSTGKLFWGELSRLHCPALLDMQCFSLVGARAGGEVRRGFHGTDDGVLS